MDNIKILIRELLYLILAGLSFVPTVLGRIVAIILIGILVIRFVGNLQRSRQEWRDAAPIPNKEQK